MFIYLIDSLDLRDVGLRFALRQATCPGYACLERASTLGKLLQTLASNIKIVHGQEIAHFGMMGLMIDRRTVFYYHHLTESLQHLIP